MMSPGYACVMLGFGFFSILTDCITISTCPRAKPLLFSYVGFIPDNGEVLFIVVLLADLVFLFSVMDSLQPFL